MGVNVIGGKITYEAVAQAHGLEYTPLADVVLARPSVFGGRLRPVFADGNGLSLTTTQVTPAARPITQTMKSRIPSNPRASSTEVG